VGKCESRAFCAICKLGEKVWFWTFPPSGFSTAVSPAALCFFFPMRGAALLRGFRTKLAIRHLVDEFQLLINHLPQLKRIQRLAEFF
jgi:hypothetical protein